MATDSRITLESAALDRACVNAIREILGIGPLYGSVGSRRPAIERFHVDTAPASEAWKRIHPEGVSGEHVLQGLA